jgi:hypothetical protein
VALQMNRDACMKLAIQLNHPAPQVTNRDEAGRALLP